MPVNLTPNAIAAMIGGDVNLKPLVQVVDIKLIGTQERYRFMVSDGVSCQHAMISSQLNDRIKTNRVQIGSVVQLTEYISTVLQNRQVLIHLSELRFWNQMSAMESESELIKLVIVVLNMETIILNSDVIGNPKPYGPPDSAAQNALRNGSVQRSAGNHMISQNPVHNVQNLRPTSHSERPSVRPRSKLATPTTAPTITTTTTPPAAMLSKKFLREGETPEAASATSGITIEAVSAAAVIPVTAFSFKEALTWSLPLDFDAAGANAFEGLSGIGLNKLSAEDWILFWVALVNGMAIVTAAVAAIFSL
ncbi:hypothetical protein DVH24_018175 [Malus domestica]|uniref:Replication factor-A protein 1 N-terminal domain-containing protein n=1 Tax=Malus domestica TaxID=3750 RepID=A0A498KLC5_MALDO|nr:hypothetical protein DVH24_018175 [Malus domestica]